MTVVRTVDFDAFRAEQKGVPLRFKIGGDVYDLPSSLPAAVAIDVIRLKSQLGDSGEVPLEALEQFGVAIFGKELWDTVLDRHRVTIEELPSLMEQVLGAYSEDPKAASPTSEETIASSSVSSTVGRGSKRTSSGSTEST